MSPKVTMFGTPQQVHWQYNGRKKFPIKAPGVYFFEAGAIEYDYVLMYPPKATYNDIQTGEKN